ncbi:sugar ABC transporter permease, partial [Bacillus sp. SIMBA_008]|uniref:carbohydrate ABC transporter permease n=1 Tax=Bacillus sp. SIMBA_008 TaxID=3085757 RepID=UPI00397DFA46
YSMLIFLAGLKAQRAEVHEAATIDGAGPWKSFWHITLPNLRPVINVVLVLGVVYTLKVIDIILGLTNGGPANATQTI